MRLYAVVWAGAFRRYATYRTATVAGLFTNTAFGFIIAYTYTALWHLRPHLGGYGLAEAMTYVWVSQGLLAASGIMGGGFEDDLLDRIRSGDIAVDLYRPADLQLWWLAQDLGRAVFQLLARGAVPVAVGALFFDLALPADPLVWAAFLGAVLLGNVVSFAIRYVVGLSGFWLLDGTGALQLSRLAATFWSGMLLPLNVFPGLLGQVARALPWSAQLQLPADVLLGTERGWAVAGVYGFQAAWAVVLLALGRVLQTAATRRLVVQGG
ncbi:ABC-2 family transporter protein [Streptomyces sp. NPDC047002]|uniref:ABC transporter permease n=1 Tax=Streptomyces sp. NPDC047002 TaxID=3155475 RepID=UPI003454E5FF